MDQIPNWETNPDIYLMEYEQYEPEVDLMELQAIQNKIMAFTSGQSQEGLSPYETQVFLDWVTLNARQYAVRNTPDRASVAAMTGLCAPTQNLNVKLLSKMGLDARPFNTADCVGYVPLSQEDQQKMEYGFASPIVRHSVSVVSIPMTFEDGTTTVEDFLLDPTFRQFCLKENCDPQKFYDENWTTRGRPAPHPGYFMQKQVQMAMGKSEQEAQFTEDMCKTIMSRGYFHLNENTAKVYGDTFVRASERIEFQGYPINQTGMEYINNFKNIPMQMLGNRDDEKFTTLPSERIKPKGLFARIADRFQKIFGKKQEALPEAKPLKYPEQSDAVRPLNQAEMENFERGTMQVLEEYQARQDQSQDTRNEQSNEDIEYY